MKNVLIAFALLLSFTSQGQGYYVRISEKTGKPVLSTFRYYDATPQDGFVWRDLTAAINSIEKAAPTSQWVPVDKWLDGSAMTDGKLWPGWYEKVGSIYFRRAWAGEVVQAAEIGFLADETDNLGVWNALSKYLPREFHFNINFAPGAYWFSGTTVLEDHVWYITGNGVAFLYPAGCTGFFYRTNYGPMHSHISGISFNARGKDPSDTGAVRKYHGIQSSADAIYENCKAIGFSGCGAVFYGAISDKTYGPSGSNVNLSTVRHLECAANGLHGVWVVGSDANQIHFEQIDVHDNGGWGIVDQSFLGCMWYTCHDNNNAMGPYACTLLTSQASFINCYSEAHANDYKPSIFHPGVIVIGGLHGAGIQGGQTWTADKGLTASAFGGLNIADGGIYFQRRSGDENLKYEIVNDKIESSYSDAAKRFTGALHFNTSKYDPDALMVYDADTYDEGNKARMGLTGVRVPSLMVGEYHIYPYTPEYVIGKGVVLKVGDRFWVGDKEYIVTKGGEKPEWKVK